MTTPVTIWTLNKAYDLISGPRTFPVEKTAAQVQAELCTEFKDTIIFGKRDGFDNQLMPDVEYFVPIAPKCIGRYFDSQNEQLAAINNYYTGVGQSPYKTFWDKETDGYRMQTPDYKGYYSLIEDNPSTILIGYSQGGLVARYLYWLDRNVFRKNLIRAVITISSPDFGSPLANSDNAVSIFTGLFEIVGILLGRKPAWMKSSIAEKIDHAIIRHFLKVILARIKSDEHRNSLSSEHAAKQPALAKFLEELYNWLGGLRNDPDNAFYDLNLMRMEPDYSKQAATYSVLASINAATAPADDIRAVVSVDMSSKALLYDAAIMIIIEELEKCLHENRALKAIFEEAEIIVEKKEARLTEDTFEQIDTIYSQTVMSENSTKPLSSEAVKNTIERHTTGVTSPVTCKPYAHDFIIPSAYQLTCFADGGISEKTVVNTDANHLSGSDLSFPAGTYNRNIVIEYLRDILD